MLSKEKFCDCPSKMIKYIVQKKEAAKYWILDR